MSELPAPVRAVCATFLSAVSPGLVTGLYLRGGLAFGEWVRGKSDVDFTATLARRPSEGDVAALRAAHEIVASEYGDQPCFDGSHLLVEDLKRPPAECPDVPAVLGHEFCVCDAYDPVSWHELARHGVTVAGPPVATLGVWTDDSLLRDHTINNLDTYWRGQAAALAANPTAAATPFTCEWVVPGVARLHHLLVTGEQTSKSRAVRWGLQYYPERFHRVLRESLAVREGAFEPQYADLGERALDVAAFAEHVISTSTRE